MWTSWVSISREQVNRACSACRCFKAGNQQEFTVHTFGMAPHLHRPPLSTGKGEDNQEAERRAPENIWKKCRLQEDHTRALDPAGQDEENGEGDRRRMLDFKPSPENRGPAGQDEENPEGERRRMLDFNPSPEIRGPAGQDEGNPEGERKRRPKLKSPIKIWKDRKEKDQAQNPGPVGRDEENPEAESREMFKLKSPLKAWKNHREKQNQTQTVGPAGQDEENPEGERKRWPKLKSPIKIWKDRKEKDKIQNPGPARQHVENLQEEKRRPSKLKSPIKIWKKRKEKQDQTQTATGESEENRGEMERWKKSKNPLKIRKNRKQQQEQADTTDDGLDCLKGLTQEVEVGEEPLVEVSRSLIIREEQIFSQDSLAEEEEEDHLQMDFEAHRLQLWMALYKTFSSSPSLGQLEVLRSAVASIQQQEIQDRRWMDCLQDRVPAWRPQKCLSTHNTLLKNIVGSRLTRAKENDEIGPNDLSSPLKREVFRMGKCVKEDLLMVERMVKDCYPPHMDILNLHAGFYHQSFSARLTEFAASDLLPDDCTYMLLWINHYYPHEILNHKDLEGKIKTDCLGSLLLPDLLSQLEEQYLTHKEDQVKLWLNNALKNEEESWLRDRKPELLDQYYFSPLAIDVIQLIDGSMTEFNSVIRDKRKAERITVHLEHLLSRYKNSLEDFVKGNQSNVRSVVKAHLVCEQQLRNYITAQTGSLTEQQRRRCLDALSALWDCGYRCLTRPIHIQLKESLSPLWTPVWLDGSVPVIDSLLDSLYQQLSDLADLKPACRQSLLCVLHQHVVVQYVKMMMKTRMKSREQQVEGTQRMIEDTRKMEHFFKEGGCSETLWLGHILRSLAEIFRLQDPESLQLEMVNVARTFPDLSDAHVSLLLSLKSNLSAAEVRSIRQSVAENRLLPVPSEPYPAFFSNIKVKWITKVNKIGMKF